MAERAEKPEPQNLGNPKKRQNVNHESGQDSSPSKKTDTKSTGRNSFTPQNENVTACPTCGKKHRGECRRNIGACFLCGQTGHKVQTTKENLTLINADISWIVKPPAPCTEAKKDDLVMLRVYALQPDKPKNY